MASGREIEPLKQRTYEWIVHHTPECRKVAIGDSELTRVEQKELLLPGTWYYDAAAQSLHVRIHAVAGGDEIVNISF